MNSPYRHPGVIPKDLEPSFAERARLFGRSILRGTWALTKELGACFLGLVEACGTFAGGLVIFLGMGWLRMRGIQAIGDNIAEDWASRPPTKDHTESRATDPIVPPSWPVMRWWMVPTDKGPVVESRSMSSVGVDGVVRCVGQEVYDLRCDDPRILSAACGGLSMPDIQAIARILTHALQASVRPTDNAWQRDVDQLNGRMQRMTTRAAAIEAEHHMHDGDNP